MSQYAVAYIKGDQWLAQGPMDLCYEKSFNDIRPKDLERCNFALAVYRDDKICAFVTCIEMDGETGYWQFGGAFDEIKKSTSVIKAYISMIDKMRELGYKRITTRIENTNIPMLRLAMKCGFVITGTWNFKNTIYLELLNEFAGATCQ